MLKEPEMAWEQVVHKVATASLPTQSKYQQKDLAYCTPCVCDALVVVARGGGCRGTDLVIDESVALSGGHSGAQLSLVHGISQGLLCER
jgi:hypothetical protein